MPQHLTVKWVRAFSPDTEREYYAVLIENVNPLFVLRYVNIGPGCVVCVTRAPAKAGPHLILGPASRFVRYRNLAIGGSW